MPPKSKSVRFLFLPGVVICGVVLWSHYYGSVSTVQDDLLEGLGFRLEMDKETGVKSRLLHLSLTGQMLLLLRISIGSLALRSVPMDHLSPSGIQATIALIRKPSPLGPDHPDYRGPILFNPGGPGGSGIQLLTESGDPLAKIVGPQFDLVSFDPRGVGASIPHISFYKPNFERVIWDSAIRVIHDADVPRLWAKMKVINAMTVENDDGNLRYINTDQAARDVTYRACSRKGEAAILGILVKNTLQTMTRYGTVLGSTFAAMFPDKVERLIIDGICDADDYYATLWSKNLMDTDKGIDLFVSGCHEARPVGCHFWAPTNTAIRHNMTNLFDSVRREPIPVSSPMGPHAVVDIDMLERIVFAALYSPYALFPLLADAFAALAHGDGSILLSIVGLVDPLTCPAESHTEPVSDATAAILCNDGEEIPSDLESTQNDWPKFPKTNFRGPFNATTSHPLLIIGNTADPVTPLWAAKKMSAGSTDSVVLTQDSPGHCSVSAPSTCTQTYIRKYFVEGTLPEPGTICPTDTPIFGYQHVVPPNSVQKAFSSLSAEEQDIYGAIQELSKKNALKAMNFPMLRGLKWSISLGGVDEREIKVFDYARRWHVIDSHPCHHHLAHLKGWGSLLPSQNNKTRIWGSL
ncbi:TAP-like protein-domain-containing protein [Panaeolus papilionaceus]|nr:TAP-like protein-domain-containing protein [Panaeolus papilionaceus]